MKRLLATLYVLGLTMVVFALTMLIPLGLAWFGDDAGFMAFLEGFLPVSYTHLTLPTILRV